MDQFSQSPYFCSPPEQLVGVENFCQPNMYSAFQKFSLKSQGTIIEERVHERVADKLDEDVDVQIISSSKKRATPKRKERAAPKKRATTVAVKIEGEDNDGARQWLDAEVYQLIALRGEMEPEFVRNGKKQGTFSEIFNFFSKIY